MYDAKLLEQMADLHRSSMSDTEPTLVTGYTYPITPNAMRIAPVTSTPVLTCGLDALLR